ncbi:hypothetical protein Tco_0764390 [Tanacetum coccineum]
MKDFVCESKCSRRRYSHILLDDIVDKDAAVTPDLERKSDETEEVNIEEKEASNVKSGETEELDLETTQSSLLDSDQERLGNTNDEEVARKIQAEWDAEEERFEELKKTKPKTTLRKPTSLAQERNQMMNFLKGQGYKNLQKLKYPQMKELYDKVQASIKDSFKDFIPMDSEKEREMLKEREAKRLLRKRKATISEEQPSKKPKLRTETIDELRNYLRIVIDSPDGEYLIIHRANNHFRAFDTLWEILQGRVESSRPLRHSPIFKSWPLINNCLQITSPRPLYQVPRLTTNQIAGDCQCGHGGVRGVRIMLLEG